MHHDPNQAGLTFLRLLGLIWGVHSILLVIKRPAITGNLDADNAAIGKWNRALEQFDRDVAPNKGCERLNLGTYLIHSNDGLLSLADGIHLAHSNTFEYKVLFFDKSSELPS